MHGLRKNLVKTIVTSSMSKAESENDSTFVKHLTVLLLTNLCPRSLTFLPYAGEIKLLDHVVSYFLYRPGC